MGQHPNIKTIYYKKADFYYFKEKKIIGMIIHIATTQIVI